MKNFLALVLASTMKSCLFAFLICTSFINAAVLKDLQLYYDVEKLSEELENVAGAYMPRWGVDMNWTAIPLRNATGSSLQDGIEINNTIKKNGMLPCTNTHFLQELPYMASILDEIADKFDTEIGLVRISKVPAYSTITRHQDGRAFDLDKGSISRLHIPIITASDAIFEVGACSYNLIPGTLYYVNVSKPHAVYNKGPHDRIHLIIDVHTSPSLHAHIHSCPEM